MMGWGWLGVILEIEHGMVVSYNGHAHTNGRYFLGHCAGEVLYIRETTVHFNCVSVPRRSFSQLSLLWCDQ